VVHWLGCYPAFWIIIVYQQWSSPPVSEVPFQIRVVFLFSSSSRAYILRSCWQRCRFYWTTKVESSPLIKFNDVSSKNLFMTHHVYFFFQLRVLLWFSFFFLWVRILIISFSLSYIMSFFLICFSLMKRFSKKLVSRSIYVMILQATNLDILDQWVQPSRWPLKSSN
jgi:hypothetical protein